MFYFVLIKTITIYTSDFSDNTHTSIKLNFQETSQEHITD